MAGASMLADLDKASELRTHAKKVVSERARTVFTQAADRLEARAARKALTVGRKSRRKNRLTAGSVLV